MYYYYYCIIIICVVCSCGGGDCAVFVITWTVFNNITLLIVLFSNDAKRDTMSTIVQANRSIWSSRLVSGKGRRKKTAAEAYWPIYTDRHMTSRTGKMSRGGWKKSDRLKKEGRCWKGGECPGGWIERGIENNKVMETKEKENCEWMWKKKEEKNER